MENPDNFLSLGPCFRVFNVFNVLLKPKAITRVNVNPFPGLLCSSTVGSYVARSSEKRYRTPPNIIGVC